MDSGNKRELTWPGGRRYWGMILCMSLFPSLSLFLSLCVPLFVNTRAIWSPSIITGGPERAPGFLSIEYYFVWPPARHRPPCPCSSSFSTHPRTSRRLYIVSNASERPPSETHRIAVRQIRIDHEAGNVCIRIQIHIHIYIYTRRCIEHARKPVETAWILPTNKSVSSVLHICVTYVFVAVICMHPRLHLCFFFFFLLASLPHARAATKRIVR